MVYCARVIELKTTPRGFMIGEFQDRYGQACSIQESSLATEACLWLGVDVDLQGKEVCKRMHLTQAMAHELIGMLRHFVRTGSLGYDDPAEAFQVGTWVTGLGETNKGVYGRIIEVVKNKSVTVQDNNIAGTVGQHVCAWDRVDVVWETAPPPEPGISRYTAIMEGDGL